MRRRGRKSVPGSRGATRRDEVFAPLVDSVVGEVHPGVLLNGPGAYACTCVGRRGGGEKCLYFYEGGTRFWIPCVCLAGRSNLQRQARRRATYIRVSIFADQRLG